MNDLTGVAGTDYSATVQFAIESVPGSDRQSPYSVTLSVAAGVSATSMTMGDLQPVALIQQEGIRKLGTFPVQINKTKSTTGDEICTMSSYPTLANHHAR